jgi:CRP/FNR family transcriptional regulator, cyclic AMP receptor protein
LIKSCGNRAGSDRSYPKKVAKTQAEIDIMSQAVAGTAMLRSIPLFNALSDEDLKMVDGLAVEKQVPKNTVVFSKGEIGDSLFAVVAGRVKVFVGDSDGREIILKILGPGDFFGEMAMVDKQPRSASVATLENSVFKVLSHTAFEAALERAPRIAGSVMQALAKRLREADRKISTLALMDVYGRVSHTLLDLAVMNDGKLVVAEKLSQQELANMVGASREMVNRILKDLTERGYISIESKTITIHNNKLPPSLGA